MDNDAVCCGIDQPRKDSTAEAHWLDLAIIYWTMPGSVWQLCVPPDKCLFKVRRLTGMGDGCGEQITMAVTGLGLYVCVPNQIESFKTQLGVSEILKTWRLIAGFYRMKWSELDTQFLTTASKFYYDHTNCSSTFKDLCPFWKTNMDTRTYQI